MSIKLAFSTVACPEWTLQQVLEHAEQIGYEGVELRTAGPGGSQFSSDPALSDPKAIAELLGASPVEPVCLSTSVSLHHSRTAAAKAAIAQLRSDLKLAAAIGCKYVRIFGHQVEPGQNRRAVIQRIAGRVQPLAEEAAERGVQILLENAGSFNHAKEWWWLFNLVEHPMVGMCWNVANAVAAGEIPAVSVPTLNTRIRLAKVKDAHVGHGDGFVPLGEGNVGIEVFLKRLLGQGFDGFVSVEWDRAWLPSLTPAAEYLPDAYERLKKWLDDIEALEEKGRKAVEKVAKRNAPKPAAAV